MNDGVTLSRVQLRQVEKAMRDVGAPIGGDGRQSMRTVSLVAGTYNYAHSSWTLKADVDMDGIVLPLCAGVFETHVDGRPDPRRLGAMITARMADASRARAVIEERLARTSAAASEAASRIGARVVEVRLARYGCGCRVPARDLQLEVDVEFLDHALRTVVETLTGYSPREFRGAIACRAPEQRRRITRRDRIAAVGALEVSAIAEAAIVFAGRSVGSVAADLLAAKECGGWTQLSGTQWKDHVCVRLLDGMIVCSAMIPGVGYIDTREIWIEGALPEAVQMALHGRRLDRIAEHPILQCDARLGHGRISDGTRTDFKVKSARRTVTAAEMASRGIAA